MKRTFMLAVALTAIAVPAMAHAFLRTAAPAAGENVRGPVVRIILNFSESLEQAFSGITVTDEAGQDEALGPPVSIIGGTEMDLFLKPLPPGRYRVVWHAVSVDTHRTEGKYNFLVLP